MRTTALEMLSEPLSLLLLLAALVLAVLAPAFHYHQFGDPTRMARDAGFSALFTCGSVLAVFGTIRSFRREIESGTLEMALARPVSRTTFFLAKTFGATLAYLVFVTIVFATAVTVVNGADIGGLLARRTGDVARLWGPSLAIGMCVIVLPLVIGALLNRFGRFRFVLSAFALALVLSVAGTAYQFAFSFVIRLIPVAVTIVLLTLVFLSASAAFAMRWRANAAATAVGGVVALSVPAVGNYYLADILSNGGSLPWDYVGVAALVTLPAVIGFLLLGVNFIVAHGEK